MADIDIVPKQRSYTWLWIVLALVILAVLWWAFASGGNEATEPGVSLRPAIGHVAGLIGSLGAAA